MRTFNFRSALQMRILAICDRGELSESLSDAIRFLPSCCWKRLFTAFEQEHRRQINLVVKFAFEMNF